METEHLLMRGGASDPDVCLTSTSTCEVSCETCGLVQEEECLEVNETRERGQGKGLEHDLLQVAPNMEAGGSHPRRRQRRSESWKVDPTAARDPSNDRVPGAPGKEARRGE